jgi:rod shape-determining protein MreD
MRILGGFLLLLVVALLLRSTALSALAVRGILIDVLVFATVVWSLRHGETAGVTFGFIIGLAADLDAAHWLGRHALIMAALGYVIGRLSHTLVRESFRTQLVLLAAATPVHQLWVTAFELQGLAGVPYLVQRVVLATVATAPLGALVITFIGRASGRGAFGHAAHEPGPTI